MLFEKARYYNTLRIEQMKLVHGDDFNVVGNNIVLKDKVFSKFTPYEKMIVESEPPKESRGKNFSGRTYETKE